MISHGCPHCYGNIMMLDDALHSHKCMDCGCLFESRVVLIVKGDNCISDMEVWEDDSDVVKTPSERLRGL